MKIENLLKSYKLQDLVLKTVEFNVKKVNLEKRLVTGQVYAPYCLDSHGHFMTAAELEKVCHNFMASGLQDQIDVMHDNNVIDAVVVESFIARGHPDWEEGSWVATTKINDDDTWEGVKKGQYNGYSFEILTFRNDVEVEINFNAWYYGFTDPDPIDKHFHAYLLRMDAEGNVIGGRTSEVDGHDHEIVTSNITKMADKHRHRIHLEKS